MILIAVDAWVPVVSALVGLAVSLVCLRAYMNSKK
jgi:hypothetical protein